MKNATQQATAKSAKQFIDYYTQHPAQNPFLSSYFREYHDRQKYVGKLTLADVEQLVKNIYESDGFMTYKPEQFQKVFEFCKAKIEVAYIAQVFESEHGSLWNFMTTNYFNTSSRKEAALLSVFRYVNALPVGR